MDSQPKKPYVRQMTEKRREQNRRSQKAYREKLKKRLEELEDQVQDKHELKQQISSEPSENFARKAASIRPPSPEAVKTSHTRFIDLNDAFAAAGDLALPANTYLPSIELTMRGRNDGNVQITPVQSTPSHSPFEAENELPKHLAGDILVPPDPDSPDMRFLWPVPSSTYWETYILPPTNRRTSKYSSTISLGSTPSLTSYPTPFSRSTSTLPPSFTSPSGMPSPYLNHLLLLGESAFSATLSIATLLGINRSAYINDHPSLFTIIPGTTTISPSVTSHTHIPKTLRPTQQQTTLPHPIYLDCIIFPSFRSKAIILSSRGELDHASLFLDLMHDGLVCRGREAACKTHGRDMRDGVAWSARSWEARPWFLQRWGWLIQLDLESLVQGEMVMSTDDDGGDADGILEGSTWWRSVNGEEGEEEGEELGVTFSKYANCNVGLRDMGKAFMWESGYRFPFEMNEDGTKKLEPPPVMKTSLSG